MNNISKLESFGPPDEIIHAMNVIDFDDEKVANALGLTKNLTVSALLPIGYPAESTAPLPLHTQFREFADTIEES